MPDRQKGRSKTVDLLRLGAGLGGLAIVAMGAAGMIDRLIKDNRDWVVAAPIGSASETDGLVFRDLLERKVIWVERSFGSLRIGHSVCSALTRDQPEEALLSNGSRAAEGPAADAVRALCGPNQGERIRNSIEAYNGGFQLVAVRDDLAGAALRKDRRVLCQLDGTVAPLVSPRGCLPSAWEMRHGDVGQPLPAQGDQLIPAWEYDFLADAHRSGFTDWIAAPMSRPEAVMTLSTRPPSTGAPLHVQIIGIALRVRVNDGIWRDVPVSAADGTWTMKEDGLSLSAGMRCPPGGMLSPSGEPLPAPPLAPDGVGAPCTPATAQGRPLATLLRVSGSADTLAIETQAAALLPGRLRRKGGAATVSWRSDLLSMVCDSDWKPPAGVAPGSLVAGLRPETGCNLYWSAPRGVEQGLPAEPEALSQGASLALLNDAGRLTESAANLELHRLVGLGADDPGSLAATLADGSGAVELSIDTRIQEAALAALEAKMDCSGDPCVRRGDLVVISIRDGRAGEVRAAATVPRSQRGLSHWDVRTLERASPADSPLAGHPWKAMDFLSTPGSVFKIVISLAAIEKLAALPPGPEADRLAAILSGDASPDEVAQMLGLRQGVMKKPVNDRDANCNVKTMSGGASTLLPIVQPDAANYCITNFTTTDSLASRALTPAESGCAGGGAAKRVGMCEALIWSSNLYFGGLSLFLEGVEPTSSARIDPARGKSLVLSATLARLYPPAPAAATGADALRHALEAGGGPDAVVRLNGDEAWLTAAKGGPSIKFELAQAGIGQSVQITPLTMALIAASIEQGEVVTPRLAIDAAARPPAAPLIPDSASRQQLVQRLLDQLRRGMHGVVLTGTGKVLKQLEEGLGLDIYAKTGTATVLSSEAPHGSYAAWMVGYAVPRSPQTEPLAFACRIGPAHKGGGEICGPVVFDLLQRIYGKS